jgi:cell division septal protein FtsQ
MTDTFYVYAPVVQGNVLVPAEEIVRQSGVINQSIFFISASQVEKAVASIPGVKSAKVQTALPSKVVISVQEREPAAVWQSGPSTMWVDSEGVLLPMRSARTDPSGLSPSGRSLPLIIDRDEQPLQANERVDAGAVQAAMVLRGRLPRSKQFDYSRSRGLAFTDSEGRLIVIGTNEEIENKLAILAALSQEIQQKGLAVKFIDLRFTQRPYYR